MLVPVKVGGYYEIYITQECEAITKFLMMSSLIYLSVGQTELLNLIS